MDYRINVIIEVSLGAEASADDALQLLKNAKIDGFIIDEEFEPVEMESSNNFDTGGGKTYVLHGRVENEDIIQRLRSIPGVFEIWGDPRIEGFKP